MPRSEVRRLVVMEPAEAANLIFGLQAEVERLRRGDAEGREPLKVKPLPIEDE